MPCLPSTDISLFKNPEYDEFMKFAEPNFKQIKNIYSNIVQLRVNCMTKIIDRGLVSQVN